MEQELKSTDNIFVESQTSGNEIDGDAVGSQLTCIVKLFFFPSFHHGRVEHVVLHHDVVDMALRSPVESDVLSVGRIERKESASGILAMECRWLVQEIIRQ